MERPATAVASGRDRLMLPARRTQTPAKAGTARTRPQSNREFTAPTPATAASRVPLRPERLLSVARLCIYTGALLRRHGTTRMAPRKAGMCAVSATGRIAMPLSLRSREPRFPDRTHYALARNAIAGEWRDGAAARLVLALILRVLSSGTAIGSGAA